VFSESFFYFSAFGLFGASMRLSLRARFAHANLIPSNLSPLWRGTFFVSSNKRLTRQQAETKSIRLEKKMQKTQKNRITKYIHVFFFSGRTSCVQFCSRQN
jgi:hypothetical protein